MKNCLLLFILLTFHRCNCFSQTYIEPLSGYQSDIANHGKFHQINSGIQLSFKKSSRYELIARIQKSWGLPYHSVDSSFTANSTLPLYEPANKTIISEAWYLSLDHRFILKSKGKNHQFSILLLTGISGQIFKVNYKYDKVDYAILNPDQTQKTGGVSIGTGFEYMRLFKNDRLFFRLTIDAPLMGEITYPSSFKPMSLLAFNAGYSFLIKKKKHEK